MTALLRLGLAIASAAWLAGCATLPATAPSAVVTSARTSVVPADRARDAVVIGKSTKAEVAAALGATLAIAFDSGFEVWVYRLSGDASEATLAQRAARVISDDATPEARAEFVILFAPSGVAAKTRIRPAPHRPRDR